MLDVMCVLCFAQCITLACLEYVTLFPEFPRHPLVNKMHRRISRTPSKNPPTLKLVHYITNLSHNTHPVYGTHFETLARIDYSIVHYI
jgi:hypothetical protein